jgi:hypothetical protein
MMRFCFSRLFLFLHIKGFNNNLDSSEFEEQFQHRTLLKIVYRFSFANQLSIKNIYSFALVLNDKLQQYLSNLLFLISRRLWPAIAVVSTSYVTSGEFVKSKVAGVRDEASPSLYIRFVWNSHLYFPLWS